MGRKKEKLASKANSVNMGNQYIEELKYVSALLLPVVSKPVSMAAHLRLAIARRRRQIRGVALRSRGHESERK